MVIKKSGRLRMVDLPVITGIPGLNNPESVKNNSAKITLAYDIIKNIRNEKINLYEEISEINLENYPDIVMYLYNPVIPVYFSKFNLYEKLYILSEYLTCLKSAGKLYLLSSFSGIAMIQLDLILFCCPPLKT